MKSPRYSPAVNNPISQKRASGVSPEDQNKTNPHFYNTSHSPAPPGESGERHLVLSRRLRFSSVSLATTPRARRPPCLPKFRLPRTSLIVLLTCNGDFSGRYPCPSVVTSFHPLTPLFPDWRET